MIIIVLRSPLFVKGLLYASVLIKVGAVRF